MTSKYFISAWWLVTDLISIFNADSRKSVSKFSGLRWFFLFEDLYNREQSLKKKEKKEKKSCSKSVKLYFYCSTQIYDSVIRYFLFSKIEFLKKPNVVFT